MLLQKQAGAGQDVPSGSSSATDGAQAGAPPQPPPAGGPSSQFASKTLADLLSAQEGPPTASAVVNGLMQQVDTNGDGQLSPDEIAKAMGADTTSGTDSLSQAISKLDTNGDGNLSADELSAGLDAAKSGQAGKSGHAHHHHHAQAASSSDMATQILGQADGNGDGSLSLDEIQTALGSGSADGLKKAFGQLDTSGDGQLSSSELTTALDAFRSAHSRAGAAATNTPAQTSVTA